MIDTRFWKTPKGICGIINDVNQKDIFLDI